MSLGCSSYHFARRCSHYFEDVVARSTEEEAPSDAARHLLLSGAFSTQLNGQGSEGADEPVNIAAKKICWNS
jgi:hypothetical protein